MQWVKVSSIDGKITQIACMPGNEDNYPRVHLLTKDGDLYRMYPDGTGLEELQE